MGRRQQREERAAKERKNGGGGGGHSVSGTTQLPHPAPLPPALHPCTYQMEPLRAQLTCRQGARQGEGRGRVDGTAASRRRASTAHPSIQLPAREPDFRNTPVGPW